MNEQEKKLPPSQQWDQVAYKLISDVLAPKGYKKITSGAHRGSVIAKCDRPGLDKFQVTRCQRATAQIVREYRTRAKKSLQDRLATVEQKAKQAEEAFSNCKFWEIGKKGQLQKEYFHHRDQVGLLTILINELDKIEVK